MGGQGYRMTDNLSNPDDSRFGKDFLTGCLSLVIIFIIIFILVPLFIFVLRISLAIVLPIAFVFLIILLTAFFGRIINNAIKKRRE
jgi:hypothetical protein